MCRARCGFGIAPQKRQLKSCTKLLPHASTAGAAMLDRWSTRASHGRSRWDARSPMSAGASARVDRATTRPSAVGLSLRGDASCGRGRRRGVAGALLPRRGRCLRRDLSATSKLPGLRRGDRSVPAVLRAAAGAPVAAQVRDLRPGESPRVQLLRRVRRQASGACTGRSRGSVRAGAPLGDGAVRRSLGLHGALGAHRPRGDPFDGRSAA